MIQLGRFVDNLKSKYDLNTSQYEAALTLSPIELSFAFKKADEDEQYRSLHVEPLLDGRQISSDSVFAARQEHNHAPQ